MAFYTEFYPEIFHFEIQKKYGKQLRIQKRLWIYVSNTIYNLIMAELKIFLQYEASTVHYIALLQWYILERQDLFFFCEEELHLAFFST